MKIMDIKDKENKAKDYYNNGQYDSAIKICKRILRKDSHNMFAQTLLGNICFLLHNYDKALYHYRELEKSHPQYIVNLLNIANTYYELKQYPEAEQYARQVLLQNSQDITALSLLGNSLQQQENPDSALVYFEQILEQVPNDCWTLNSLSQIWQQKGDNDNAFYYAFKAVENSSGDDSQQLNLGYLLYEIVLDKGIDSVRDKISLWKEKYGELPQVSYMINALENNHKIEIADMSYLQNVFDNFADGFEEVLSGLNYSAPQYIEEYMHKFYSHLRWKKLQILDAGCGTGLCGIFLKKYAKWRGLEGVDISTGMLKEAQKKKLYNRLYCQELCEFLSSKKTCYDVIVAADVLTYFGNLQDLIKKFSYSLKNNGRIIFTITKNSQENLDWFLHSSARFSHSFSYVEKLLKKYNFALEEYCEKNLRTEGAENVVGYVISARKNQ